MGDGEYDAEEPAGRRPLPPDDRIWRHPAEVAMEARQLRARRRARRSRIGATLVGGVVVGSGLFWLGRAAPTDVSVTSDVVPRSGATDNLAASVEPQELFAFRSESGDAESGDAEPVDVEPGPAESGPAESDRVILVRSSANGETLAGALMVRDGYVVTSGTALAGAEDVIVSWGDRSEAGIVIGHDTVTDVTVIRIYGAAPFQTADVRTVTDATVTAGDEITMTGADGLSATRRVVAPTSTSERTNGEPMVGIVELDGRIGDVSPGTPAYDMNGAVVGIATATADSAPAAIIPIDLAREVADEIIDDGEATHPWLGVRARNPEPADGVSDDGSFVTAISSDGPAARGGMVEGDLITSIDEHTVDSMAAMVATLRSYEPGDVVSITVERDGAEVGCTVELASHLDVDA